VSRTAGHSYRFRPTEEALEDVASLENRLVFFVNDIINGHRAHALQLFRSLKVKGLKWAGQATVLIARDGELMDAAFEAGCRGLFIGFETFFEACEALHRKRIAIWGGFVFGLDSDTIESLQETARLAAEAKLEFAQFSRLTPLPGTAQWKQFEAEDRPVERDWSKVKLFWIYLSISAVAVRRINRGTRKWKNGREG